MGRNGDAGGDVSGEEAAWRDLVARFDVPVDTTTAPPPWPAREDLTDTPGGRARPGRDGALGRDQAGPGGRSGLARPGTSGRPGTPGRPGAPGRPGGSGRPGAAGRPGPAERTGPPEPARDGLAPDDLAAGDDGLAAGGSARDGRAGTAGRPAEPLDLPEAGRSHPSERPADPAGLARPPRGPGRDGGSTPGQQDAADTAPGLFSPSPLDPDARGPEVFGRPAGRPGTGAGHGSNGHGSSNGHSGNGSSNGHGNSNNNGHAAGNQGAAGTDAAGAGTADAPPASRGQRGRHAGGVTGDRARIIRRAVPPPTPPGDDADADADDRYVPPPPEPLPQLDPVAKGAWAGLLGGPAYLIVASVTGELPSWGALVAIVAFIAGGVTLFLRMSDRPRDDDDDGAVV